MICKHWPVSFTANYGGGLPNTYCCFDLETTGFDRQKDVIIEIGHVLVVDGEVTDELSVLLDWSKHSVVPQHWLRDRIGALRQTLSDRGVAHHLPYERLCEEGIDPTEALTFYLNYFNKLKANGTAVVGHNVYRFDEPMLEANLVGFQIADRFSFGDWQLWDTLALEAATQAGPGHKKAIPEPGQTLRDWMTKASYIKAETNLTRTLVKRYNLVDKYGLDTRQSHSACYDAKLCHLMMQEYRQMLDAEPQPEPVKVPQIAMPTGPKPIPVPGGLPKTPKTVPNGQRQQGTLFDDTPDEPPPPVVHGDANRRRRQRNR